MDGLIKRATFVRVAVEDVDMGILSGQGHRMRCVQILLASSLAAACVLVSSIVAHGSFGAGGKEVLKLGKSNGPHRAVAYPGGRLLLQGVFFGRSGLVRLRSDGARDRSFADDGYAPLGVLSAVGNLAIQGDGKIVLAGERASSPPTGSNDSDLIVVRLNADGSFDRSFGDRGTREVDFGDPNASGKSVAVLPDGRIVVGGGSGTAARITDSNAAIARLQPNGALDRSFSRDGKLVFPVVSSIYTHVEDVSASSSGVLTAAVVGDSGMEVFRFQKGGAADPTFGRDGHIAVDPPGFDWRNGKTFEPIQQIAVAPDGKIVVVGTASRQRRKGQADRSIAAVRYSADGRLDRSFGAGGIARAAFRNFVAASAFAVQASGRLIVVGGAYTPERVFAAVCFRPDGRLDRRFGHAGKAKIGFARRIG